MSNQTAPSSVDQIRLSIQHLPFATFLLHNDRVLLCNLAFVNLLGFSSGDLESITIEKFIAKRYFLKFNKLLKSLKEGKREVEQNDLKVVSKNGTELWVEASIRLLVLQNKEYVLVQMLNVTKIRNDIERQKRNNEKLQNFIYRANRAVVSFDQDFNYINSNVEFSKLVKLSLPELKVMNLKRFFRFHNDGEFEENLLSLFNSKNDNFFHLLSFNDQEFNDVYLWCEFHIGIEGKQKGKVITVISEDVSNLIMLNDRLRIDAELDEHRLLATESENKQLTKQLSVAKEFRARERKSAESKQYLMYRIINNNPNLIFIKDFNQCYQLVNKTFANLLQLHVNEIIGKTDKELQIKVLSSNTIVRKIPSFTDTRNDFEQLEETIRFPNGAEYHYLTSRVVVSKDELEYDGNLYIATNITELVDTQKALQEQLAVEKAIHESIPAYVFRKDKDHVYVQANQAFLDFNGLRREELIKKTDHDLYPQEQADWFVESDKKILETRQPLFNLVKKELTADGSERWVSTNKAPYFNANGEVIGIIGLAFDITEKKEKADRLNLQYNMEKLILEISTRFINIDINDVDKEIEKALEQVSIFLKSNYALIIYADDQRQSITRTHSWSTEELQGTSTGVSNLPLEQAPYFTRMMLDKQNLIYNSLDEMPEEAALERSILQQKNIQSCLIIPLVYEKEIKGSLCFCSIGITQSWNEDYLILCRMLSDIVINALERKRKSIDIHKFNQLIKTTIDANLIAILSTDLEGKINLATGALLARLDISANSVFGKRIGNVIEFFTDFDSVIARLNHNERLTEELNIKNISIELQFVAYQNRAQDAGFIVTLTDISDFKHTQEQVIKQHSQFLAIFNQTDYLTFVTNPTNNRIIFANQRFRDYYDGYYIGRNCQEVMLGKTNSNRNCFANNNESDPSLMTNAIEILDKKNRMLNVFSQNITWIDGSNVNYHTAIDITETKFIRDLANIQQQTHTALGNCASVEETLAVVLQALLDITGFEMGGVYLFRPQGKSVYLAYQIGCPPEFVEKVRTYSIKNHKWQLLTSQKFLFGPFAEIKENLPDNIQDANFASGCHIAAQYDGKVNALISLASSKEVILKPEAKELIDTLTLRLSRIIYRFDIEKKYSYLKAVFNTTEEMVLLLGYDRTFLFANTQFYKITGYSSTDIIGEKVFPTQRGVHNLNFYKFLMKSMVAGHKWNGELMFRYSDGSIHKLFSRIEPVMDDNNHLQYIISRSTEL